MSVSTGRASVPLPNVAHVKDLLGMLFDGLTVKSGKVSSLTRKTGNFAAIYLAADESPAGACVCDLAFAACSGAALSMLPPSASKEALNAKALPALMTANLSEVMNICTRLILRENSMHVRLERIYPLEIAPEGVFKLMSDSKASVHFEIGIGRYGVGELTVISFET